MKYPATLITVFAISLLSCQAEVQVYGVRSPSRDRPPPKSWQQIKAARGSLVSAQNPDGSWGGDPDRVRETSLALLGFTNSNVPGDYRDSVRRGMEWLLASGEQAEPDLTAIRLIALAELVNQSGDDLRPQVIELMKKEAARLITVPSKPWRDLLAIAPFPSGIDRPTVVPASWTVHDTHLNKDLTPEDLSKISDLRIFVLHTFASAHWSGQNSRVSARAKYELWERQKPDGSFPPLAKEYGSAGATGLMFLVNKGWMHCAYQYLWNERQAAKDKNLLEKTTDRIPTTEDIEIEIKL